MNQTELLKFLDTLCGGLLCRLLPQAAVTGRLLGLRRILLIRPGGIGDAVLLTPAIAALKKKFPEAAITVLAEKRNAGIFALSPGVDRLLRYDVPGELLAAFRLKPDVVIDSEQYHRLSAVVARLTGAKVGIGFSTNARTRLFHHAISYSHNDYEAESFLRLLTPLGINPPATLAPPFLKVPKAATARAAHLLAHLAGQPLVVLFPGASIPERRWEAKHFAEVASCLHRDGYGIVVVGGREDATSGEAISAGNGLNLAGLTSLTETAAIIARAALLISGDSGILHLGVGLGIPTVSLFGPGIARKWAPHGPQHIVLNHHLPCSPCTKFGCTPRCQLNAECIKSITPAEVLSAALTLLSKSS